MIELNNNAYQDTELKFKDNETNLSYKKNRKLKILIICLTVIIITLIGIMLWLYFHLTESPFIGIWIREIEENEQTLNIKFEVKRDKTFMYEQKQQGKIMSINGKWTASDNKLTMSYLIDGKNTEYNMFLIDPEIICMGTQNCEEYAKLINITSSKEKKYVIETTKEKEEFIHKIDYNDYKNLINQNYSSIILLASESCSHCQNYINSITETCEKYNIKIYYLSVNELSREQYISIHDTYDSLKERYNDVGEPIIPTPTTIVVKNGQEITLKIGNIGNDGFINLLKDIGIINSSY